MHQPQALYQHPNALAAHYRRFAVAERLLLTGHSHQAWPDCGFAAHEQAWLDAAELVDDKWERAFDKAAAVRRGFARLLGVSAAELCLGANTHELLVRFLSALPLARRPRLITTDGEYHTIRRQLDRLAEEGLEVVKVKALPAASLGERLAAAVDERSSAVLVSAVLFQSGQVAGGLAELAAICERHGAALLVDAYHALGVVPFELSPQGLTTAFVVGGGYKYCQLGEGNCFLRLPTGCSLRPVVTGWFSEFSLIAAKSAPGEVAYGSEGERFAGSTYDPTSHYRAAAVFDFFAAEGLEVPLLRQVSQHQLGVLAAAFDRLSLDPRVVCRQHEVPLAGLGGFLALRSPQAAALGQGLKERGVYSDHRGEFLRLGPAPYLSDRQLEDAIALLGETCRSLA